MTELQQRTEASYEERTSIESAVYAGVLNFYAGQMRALDARRFDDYVSTFAEDGVMTHPDGVSDTGREAIMARLVQRAPAFEDITVCHWFNMIQIEEFTDTAVHTSYYAMVTCTGADGITALSAPFIVRDVLDRSGHSLQTRDRSIAQFTI